MKEQELFDNGSRKWYFFGRDKNRDKSIVDTNEYLILNDDKGLLLDPGGVEIFPSVVNAISKLLPLDNIEALFASHQDPDILSSLALWLGVSKPNKIYVSKIWSSYFSQFSTEKQMTSIPDEGFHIPLGESNDLLLVPAHYMHSPGNFSLYDPTAKILFSGDIGSADLPDDYSDAFVQDFDKHIQYMKKFHQRYMPSSTAKNNWVRRIRELDVEMICPHHGAIFQGQQVGQFLNWLEELEVALAV